MIVANRGIIVSDGDGANMFMLMVGSLSTDWAWVNVTRLLYEIYLIEESTDGEHVCACRAEQWHGVSKQEIRRCLAEVEMCEGV